MKVILRALIELVVSFVRSRVSLQVEIVALRHLLAVYQRTIRRPVVRASDRIFWAWLARHWGRWQATLIFEPATVLAWQRRRFREHWTRLSRREPGRPAVSQEPRTLIQDLSAANPRRDLPRNLGELRKLGIAVAKSRRTASARAGHPHRRGAPFSIITCRSSSRWISSRPPRSASRCSSC